MVKLYRLLLIVYITGTLCNCFWSNNGVTSLYIYSTFHIKFCLDMFSHRERSDDDIMIWCPVLSCCSVHWVLLTKLWRACVELLWQETVISETLHGVSHRDDGHHHQPAPQDVQKATHPDCLCVCETHLSGRKEDSLTNAHSRWYKTKLALL